MPAVFAGSGTRTKLREVLCETMLTGEYHLYLGTIFVLNNVKPSKVPESNIGTVSLVVNTCAVQGQHMNLGSAQVSLDRRATNLTSSELEDRNHVVILSAFI